MTVNEQALQVNTDDLIQWAIAHERAAEACGQACTDHARTVAAAQSWGPLFYEARRAAVAAVNDRETALRDQQERHGAMAQQLRTAAARMAEMNAENRANLTISTD